MFKTTFIIALLLGCFATHSDLHAQFDKSWWLRYSNNHVGANIINAWKVMQNNYHVKVAVIDSGIDYRHPALRGKIAINKKEIPNNNIDDDQNGCVDDYLGCRTRDMSGNIIDNVSHGTHVAGIVSKAAIRTDSRGYKSKIQIVPVNVDPPRSENVAKAIHYAISRGAQIIQLSLGTSRTPQLEEALVRAARKNIVVVVAAGNDGSTVMSYPASYEYPNIISVASSTKRNIKSYFSSYGKTNVDVFAPGSDIYSTLPNGKYGYKNGTSMAAPVVSGIVAMVLSTHGPKAMKSMRKRIMLTSRRFQSYSGFVASNGLVNARSAITGQGSFNFVWDHNRVQSR